MNRDETPSGRFAVAIDEFDRRVRAIGADQWAAPTPCSEWDVRALVNHLTGELAWMPPLLEGQTIAEVGDRLDGDLLGSDPLGGWDKAVHEARQAVRDAGALDRPTHLSYGDVPASDYVTEVTADLTVHAWDLARAIGASEELDPALVRFVYAAAQPRLDPAGFPGFFEPAIQVGDDAPEQVKLLGLYGRRP